MEHEAKKEELRETQLEALRKGKISVEIKGKIKKIEIPKLQWARSPLVRGVDECPQFA